VTTLKGGQLWPKVAVDSLFMITGKDLRRAREARRLSRKQAAEILNIGERTLGRWESDGIPESGIPAVEGFIDPARKIEPTLSEASDAEFLAEMARRLERGAEREAKPRRSPPHADQAPDSAYYRPRTGASDTG
jgi:transcriptional regulator with XRE-family HTH domain